MSEGFSDRLFDSISNGCQGNCGALSAPGRIAKTREQPNGMRMPTVATRGALRPVDRVAQCCGLRRTAKAAPAIPDCCAAGSDCTVARTDGDPQRVFALVRSERVRRIPGGSTACRNPLLRSAGPSADLSPTSLLRGKRYETDWTGSRRRSLPSIQCRLRRRPTCYSRGPEATPGIRGRSGICQPRPSKRGYMASPEARIRCSSGTEK